MRVCLDKSEERKLRQRNGQYGINFDIACFIGMFSHTKKIKQMFVHMSTISGIGPGLLVLLLNETIGFL